MNKKFFNKTKPIYEATDNSINFKIVFQTIRSPLVRLKERLNEILDKGYEINFDITMYEISQIENN